MLLVFAGFRIGKNCAKLAGESYVRNIFAIFDKLIFCESFMIRENKENKSYKGVHGGKN